MPTRSSPSFSTPAAEPTQQMADVGTIRIGISGWRYAGWRRDFYPPGLPQRRELEYASDRMGAIELNGSFYSLQRATSYVAWRDGTRRGLVFAVKGGRFITHMKKLAGVETALANSYASGVLALGPKLGPMLWQLPPTLGFDADRLSAFFGLLPRTTTQAVELARGHDGKVPDPWLTTDTDRPLRHALEVRHASFATQEAVELLRRHDIAFVVADTAGRWPLVQEPTSDHMYVRLHGDVELYTSGYSDAALDSWAERIQGWADTGRDVHVFFDNDVKVRAPYDAMALMRRLGVSTD